MRAARKSPRDRPARPKRRRRIWGRLFVTLVVALALVIGYLALWGVPQPIVRYLLRMTELSGVRIDAELLQIHPLRAVWAEEVAVGPAADPDKRIWMEAAQVEIDLDMMRWIREGNPVGGVEVSGARVRVPLDDDDPDAACFVAEQTHLDLRFEPGGDLRVRDLSGVLCGVRLRASGLLHGDVDRGSSPSFDLTAVREIFRQTVESLDRFEFDEPPLLEIRFEGTAGEWDTFDGEVTLTAAASAWRGVRADRIRIDGAFRGGTLELHELEAAAGESTFAAAGVYSPATGYGDLRVEADIAGTELAGWMPPAIEGFLAAESTEVRLHLGPGSLAPAEVRAEGAVTFRGANLSDVEFRRVSGALRYARGLLHVDELDALHASGGTMRGILAMDLKTGDWGMEAAGDVRFPSLAPWFSGALGEILASVRDAGESEWTLRGCGIAQDVSSTRWQGECSLQRLSFEQIAFDRADFNFLYDGAWIDFQRVNLERPEGRLNGDFRYHFADELLVFDVGSSLETTAVAHLLGRGAERAIEPFRFDNPPIVSASGTVDFADGGDTDVSMTVSCEGVRWWRLAADRGTAEITAVGRSIRADPFVARAYDGDVTAEVEYVTDPDGPSRFDVTVTSVSPLRFEDLRFDLTGTPAETNGRISGRFALRGPTEPRDAWTGDGEIVLDEGMIFRLPLFGGLSRLMSTIIPGMGFSSPYKARTSYKVGEGWVQTDGFTFVGDLLSLRLDGRCALDGRLDFGVRAQLLRDTILPVEVIGYLLDPLLKILEFDLEGTLEMPIWRPRSLPRELFGDGE